ncbi:hypothetical protein [Alkalibacillus haloalkaliphilus]|uniref:hypothetical protein n=1 Tax=Alkalibacillus haloalkaliphilus TaxID=94136 RepID=UPI00293673FA|nr:hypothetical protein [Alkalibacillus haloalkaliphilus]MDV2583360.1 hypothetical protein [Alkalibacillus haloalkaliphilus]
MNSLLGITVGFIVIGFVVLISLKGSMESRLAKANVEVDEGLTKTNPVVWWIVSTAIWGLVSIILVVWSFHNYFG